MMIKMITALVFVLATFGISGAADKAGEVKNYKGSVDVYREGSIRGDTVRKTGHELFVKDIVKTKRKAMASIRFIDGSEALMKEKSILEIDDIKEIGMNEGRVIFNIKEQSGLKGISIKTKSVVIGVKGTRFVVDSFDGELQVFLKEGLLNIKSLVDEFVRYRKKESEDYDKFKKKEMDDFGEYKKKEEEEFKEFVKEFEMKSGTAISIDGKEVRDISIPDDIEKEFLLLDRPDIFDAS